MHARQERKKRGEAADSHEVEEESEEGSVDGPHPTCLVDGRRQTRPVGRVYKRINKAPNLQKKKKRLGRRLLFSRPTASAARSALLVQIVLGIYSRRV